MASCLTGENNIPHTVHIFFIVRNTLIAVARLTKRSRTSIATGLTKFDKIFVTKQFAENVQEFQKMQLEQYD